MKKPTKLQEAIKVLIKALKKDKGYREGWQANIAMSFKDHYRWHKNIASKKYISAKDLHVIANGAAKGFLDLLCNEIKYPKGR